MMKYKKIMKFAKTLRAMFPLPLRDKDTVINGINVLPRAPQMSVIVPGEIVDTNLALMIIGVKEKYHVNN